MADAGQRNRGITPAGAKSNAAARRRNSSTGRSKRRSGGQPVTRRNSRRQRVNKGGCLLRIIIVILLCVAVFFFLQSSVFTVKTIEVRGLERINEEDIITLSGIEMGSNLFDVNRQEAEELIALHAAVDNVAVNTRPPHKILITVTERDAVAWVPGDDCYYLMDNQGYIFIKRQEYNDYLPLITGLELPENLPVGLQLSGIKGLDDAIEVSRVLGDYCRGQLRELHYTEKGNFVFFIGDLKVRLGKNEDMWKKKNTLDGLLQQIPASALPQVEYIDVSSPSNPVVSGYDIIAAKEKAEAEAKAKKEAEKNKSDAENQGTDGNGAQPDSENQDNSGAAAGGSSSPAAESSESSESTADSDNSTENTE